MVLLNPAPDVVVGAVGKLVVADGHVLIAAQLDAGRLPKVADPAAVEHVVVHRDVLLALQLVALLGPDSIEKCL